MIFLCLPVQSASDLARVESIEAVVTRLSPELGEPVAVDRTVAGRLLFVDRKGMSAVQTLKSVAWGLNATLRRGTDGWQIIRTESDRHQIAAHRQAKRLQWLQSRLQAQEEYRLSVRRSEMAEAIGAEIKNQVRALKEAREGKRSTLPTRYGAELLPASQCLTEIVNRIGLEKIAAMPSQTSLVYEDGPVPGAKPLPDHSDLNRKFAQGMRALTALRDLEKFDEDVRYLGATDLFSGIGATSEPVKWRLHVGALETLIRLQLEVFDADGERIGFASTTAFGVKDPAAGANLLAASAQDPKQTWLTLSQPARDAVRSAQGRAGDTLPTWFDLPEGEEPLNLFVREGLAALETGPMVVAVTDGLWSNVLGSTSEGRLNVNTLKTMMKTWSPYERVIQPGVTIWRPLDPESAESRTAHRAVLASYAKEVRRLGYPSVRANANLFYQVGPAAGDLADAWNFMANVADQSAPSPSELTVRHYRLLGAISDSGWAALERGAAKSIGELGIADAFAEFLAVDDGYRLQAPKPLPSLYQHPSEVIGKAALTSVVLSLPQREERVFHAWDAAAKEPPFWFSEEEFVSGLIGIGAQFMQRGDSDELIDSRELYEERLNRRTYRFGRRRSGRLEIALSPGVHLVAAMPGRGVPQGSPIGYLGFSSEDRDAIWRQYLEVGRQRAIAARKSAKSPAGTPTQGSAPPRG